MGYYFTANEADVVRREKKIRIRIVAMGGDDVRGRGLVDLEWVRWAD